MNCIQEETKKTNEYDSDDSILTDDETLREEAIIEITRECLKCIGNNLPLHLPILKHRRAFLYKEDITVTCNTCKEPFNVSIYY